jgi:D-psicose/D-tagatose/L-ribulose 3-epimerase
MSIGFATWMLGGTPIGGYIEELARMGYDGVEVVGDPEQIPAAELLELLDEHGLRVLAVIPKPEVDPAHPLHSRRLQAIEYYRALLAYCVKLGCHRIVIREQPGRVHPIVGHSKECEVFKQTIRSVAHSAVSMNIHLSVLPVNRYEGYLINTAQQGLEILENANLTYTDLALNSYHMNIEETDIRGTLRSVEGRIGLFYAAENHRHALGEGQLDWPEICLTLAQSGYKGDYIIECQASGADPLLSIGRASGWVDQVLDYAERSIQHLRVALAATWL